MCRWELDMCRNGQGSRMVRRDGQGGAGEGTGHGLVIGLRLLGSFADRLLRHRQPHALLLRVLGTWID